MYQFLKFSLKLHSSFFSIEIITVFSSSNFPKADKSYAIKNIYSFIISDMFS